MKLFGRRKLRWTVLTSAPGGKAGEQWGDTWFARDLVDATGDTYPTGYRGNCVDVGDGDRCERVDQRADT